MRIIFFFFLIFFIKCKDDEDVELIDIKFPREIYQNKIFLEQEISYQRARVSYDAIIQFT